VNAFDLELQKVTVVAPISLKMRGCRLRGYTKLLWPGEDLLSGFHATCEPLFQHKHNLNDQNRNLSQTRDLLLPRLISGKLSVEDRDIQFPPSMQEEATEPEPADA
jgi:hypothetical protein